MKRIQLIFLISIITIGLTITIVNGQDHKNVYVYGDCGDTCGSGATPNEPLKTLKEALEVSHEPDEMLWISIEKTQEPYSGPNNIGLEISQGTFQIRGNAAGEVVEFDCGGDQFLTIFGEQTIVSLSDLTISKGSSTTSGGMIRVYDGATFAAEHCLFTMGNAPNGGCVSLDNAKLASFTNTNFQQCSAISQGGAVWVHDTAVTFTSGNFTANNATLGASVHIAIEEDKNAASPQFHQCEFHTGRASLAGGAISVGSLSRQQEDGVKIVDSVFQDNYVEPSAGTAGGAIYHNATQAEVVVTDSEFITNAAPFGGAVAVLASGSLTVFGGSFSGNAAADGRGGALYTVAAFVSVNQTEFVFNAASEGAGLYVIGGAAHFGNPDAKDSTSLLFSTFETNTATKTGGAAFFEDLNSPIIVNGCTFARNTVLGNSDDEDVKGGGAIHGNNIRLALTGSPTSFERNAAVSSSGGAIALYNAPNSTFDRAVFTSNIADLSGGAAYLSSSGVNDEGKYSVFNLCRFSLNEAGIGSNATQGSGGALALDKVTAVVLSTLFYDNQAADKGGAVHTTSSADTFPHMNNCNFTGNTAVMGEDAYIHGKAHAVFSDCTFTKPDPLRQVLSSVAVAGSGNVTFFGTDAKLELTNLEITGSGDVLVHADKGATLDYLTLKGSGEFRFYPDVQDTDANFLITTELQWNGGGIACAHEHNTFTIGEKAQGYVFDDSENEKELSMCTFINKGSLSVTSHKAITDITFFNGAVLENHATMLMGGDVIFASVGISAQHVLSDGVLSMNTLALGTGSGQNFTLSLTANNELNVDRSNATQAELEANPSLFVDGPILLGGHLDLALPLNYPLNTQTSVIKSTSAVSGQFSGATATVEGKGQSVSITYNNNGTTLELVKTSHHHSDSCDGGCVAGIVIGVLAGVVILAGLGYYFYQKRRNSFDQVGPYESL